MATLNKVTLIGYLGRDPELRSTAAGDAVAHLAIATTETWRDKGTGEKKEATEWHRIVLYRKLAEVAGQYLKKGALVYIEGRLQTRKWTGKDEIDRITTEIVADDMRMLGSRSPGISPGDTGAEREPAAASPASATKSGNYSPQYDLEDDAIPF